MQVKSQDEIKNRNKAMVITASAYALIIILLLIMTIPQADPPVSIPLPNEVKLDLGQMEEIIQDGPQGGGGGGGTPTNDRVDPTPKPQTQEVLTSKKTDSDVSVKSGKSNKTTSENNTKNTATSTERSSNPFGDGGSGGGKGGGRGSGFGNDVGEGDGPGSGGGSGGGDGSGNSRCTCPPITDQFYSDENHKVALMFQIDSQGEVVGVKTRVGTTTTDPQIINQVISKVKPRIRCAKKTGAGLEWFYITINVKAR